MQPEWLCYVNGQEYGPYTWPQLVQMAAAGNIVPASHVRRNSDSQWYTAEQVPGLFGPAAPAGPLPAPGATRPATAVTAVAKPASKVPTGKTVARAVPVAAPATGAPAARPTATAIPAGSIPKGKVVAKAPAADVPTGSIRVGDTATMPAVSISASGNAFSIQTAATPAKPRAADGNSPEPVAKRDSTKTMVLALGGIIGAVALLGGGLVVWRMNASPATPTEVAKGVDIPTEEPDAAAPLSAGEDVGETNAPTVDAGKKSGEQKSAAKAKATDSAKARAETATLLQLVSKFTPLKSFKRVGIRDGLMVEKVSIWLASDGSGKRVAPYTAPVPVAKPAAAAPTEPEPGSPPPTTGQTLGDLIPATPAAAATAAEKPQFVFVELQIKNTSDKVQKYAGWNAEDTAALLVDDEGEPLALTPKASTPGAVRKAATEIKPGEAIPDTLVFTMNEPDDSEFRLVLPGKALSKFSKSNFGVAISTESLGGGTNVANGSGSPAGPAGAPATLRSSVAIPIPGLHDEPAKPAESEMKKDAAPASSVAIPIPGLQDEPAGAKEAGEMKKGAPAAPTTDEPKPDAASAPPAPQ